MDVSIEQAQASREAAEIFVEENLGLVRQGIKRLGLNPFDDDLFQEGCIGLLKAIQRFKPELGFAFSTYAISLIQGAIRKYRREFDMDSITGVHVTRTIKDLYSKLKDFETKGVPDEEICEQLGITQQKLDEARCILFQRCASLDQETTDADKGNKKAERYDFIPADIDIESEVLEKITWNELLEQLSARLSKRQLEVLKLRTQGLSQINIGKTVGVGQVHVSRMLRKIADIAKEILYAEGGATMKKPKITDDQLLEECRVFGTTTEASETIARKYDMQATTLRTKIYKLGILKKLKAEKEGELDSISKQEPIAESIAIEPMLKVIAWKGKECTYTFAAGKLVIGDKKGDMIQVEDYEVLLREIQELTSSREAV